MLCTVHTPLMSLFIILQFFIFFHLSHMILEVELTRNIYIKNDGLRPTLLKAVTPQIPSSKHSYYNTPASARSV